MNVVSTLFYKYSSTENTFESNCKMFPWNLRSKPYKLFFKKFVFIAIRGS